MHGLRFHLVGMMILTTYLANIIANDPRSSWGEDVSLWSRNNHFLNDVVSKTKPFDKISKNSRDDGVFYHQKAKSTSNLGSSRCFRKSTKPQETDDVKNLNPVTVVQYEPDFECPKMKSETHYGRGRHTRFRGMQSSVEVHHYLSDAEEGEFPFLALLVSKVPGKAGHKICAGSIWTRSHVVSAAHCHRAASVPTSKILALVIGAMDYTKGTMISASQIESVVLHPEYLSESASFQGVYSIYDYMVLTVNPEIELKAGSVEPVCLFLGDPRFFEGAKDPQTLMLVGWGRTEEMKNPRVAKKRWVQFQTCRIPGRTNYKCDAVWRCVNSSEGGICGGDSGAPLLAHFRALEAWVQIALHTFVIMKHETGGKTDCSHEQRGSGSLSLFYFETPGPNSATGNPWCDFFMKAIPLKPRLVHGDIHPHDICNNRTKHVDWCKRPPPNPQSQT